MEVPNFDLQFDFGFESDEENQVTSIGRKRQPDSDTETASLPKRRRLSMKPGYRNKSKELSETAKKFYSVESGESSDSEVEDANTSQNVERIATPLRVKRKVRRRRNNLELEAKARLFHSIIGENREISSPKHQAFLRGHMSAEEERLLKLWFNKVTGLDKKSI